MTTNEGDNRIQLEQLLYEALVKDPDAVVERMASLLRWLTLVMYSTP